MLSAKGADDLSEVARQCSKVCLRYALLLRAARRHETEVVGIYLSRLGLKIYARIKTRVVDRERYWCHSLMYYSYLGLGGVGIHIAQRLNRTGACHAHYAVIEGMIYTRRNSPSH